MRDLNVAPSIDALPQGWTSRAPDERDIAELAMLRASVTRAATGSGTPDVSTVTSEIIEGASWTRRQTVVHDTTGRARAWAAANDRAAGRTLLHVTIDPDLDLEIADPLAESLFDFSARVAGAYTRLRGATSCQLDTGAYEGDDRQRRWLERAGYERTRRWLQMSRPVEADEATFPTPQEGVTIRRVRRRPNGLPVAIDVQAVHRVLEDSFADHFNSYRESFPEFIHRMQQDPGHAWDHWWLAVVTDEDGTPWPGGALVSTMQSPDATDSYGSYVEYIGVRREARGRGIAKSLLETVVADAASRDRNRVGLEVDDTSPTGADGLYRSLGWDTSYVTESWHRELDAE
ncbi:MAG: GNAT family N-acetyltransferase [Mobilicoccus sp.]|nr:GNAT family N-acetyltransferase [Mobilicoccus sp.]